MEGAKGSRKPPARGNCADGLRLLLQEYERLSDAWRRQLRATLEGLEQIEAQRRTLLAMAVNGTAAVRTSQRALEGVAFPNLPALVEGYERHLVHWALATAQGSQKGAAMLLGIGPTTLHEKMKRLGLSHRQEPSLPESPPVTPLSGGPPAARTPGVGPRDP